MTRAIRRLDAALEVLRIVGHAVPRLRRDALALLAAGERVRHALARKPKTVAPCGARTRSGHPCRAAGRGCGGRCALHGGRSTGPTSPAGRARVKSVWSDLGRVAAVCRWRPAEGQRLLAELRAAQRDLIGSEGKP